ncbi:hypothetical protein [Paraburkholderia elongata]|uniref:40-residue YVTN family beta-propeller repeat-containing protein n=1 Tax=Paraburkholderia elongata TaxID=2675747 RepID=A0A972NY77_9BURK|nr:hypothetical protein [Paraburkholderia elongata]NPT61087.1 hypothetical protein [Paraburkholderia elongata]
MAPKKLACIVGLISTLAACGGGGSVSAPTNAAASIAVPASVAAALPGYKISVFAQIPGKLRPDDLLMHGNNLFVIAQDNNNNPDGTAVAGTSPQSEVIEYDKNGNIVRTFNVPGHPDGLMEYDSHTVWVSTNEDASPMLIVIDTTANTQQTLTPDVPPIHGGGLDDMKMLNGVVYAAASNPNLSAATATAPNGVSSVPSVYSVTLNPDHQTFHLTPALMGNATATNIPTNTQVTLNMTDPDSMAIDPSGNLVVDSQQDSELVFVANPGANQSVSVLPLTLYGNAWPVDDTRWAPSGNSFMLLADNSAQLVYRIDATAGFTAGTAYSAGQGTLLQVNTSTGVMTPMFTGMKTPHGLIFVGE